MTGQPAVPPPQSDTPSRPPRGPLIFASVLTIVWCALLIGMAWLTANPVTLNRDQILRAEFVITGTVDSNPATGEVSVSREWKKNGLTGAVHVENLDDARVRRGNSYVMPLSRAPTGYRLTETRLSDAIPLVYPATPEAVEQLEKILANRPATN